MDDTDGQSQKVTAEARQLQGNQRTRTSAEQSVAQTRGSPASVNRSRANQSSQAQRIAQTRQRYERSKLAVNNTGPWSSASYQPAYRNNQRSYNNTRPEHASRPDYAGSRPPLESVQRQAEFAVGARPSRSATAHNEPMRYQRQQQSQHQSQHDPRATAASTAPVGYRGTPGTRTAYQSPQSSTQNNQPPQAVKSREESDLSETDEQTYLKESEALDCIYRDGKAYCR